MNRNLFVFSLFVIVAGVAVGLYVITFFGLLLLIPALVSPTRPPGQNVPPRPTQPQPGGRVSPRRSPPPQPTTPSSMGEQAASPPSPTPPPMPSMAPSYSTVSSSPTQPATYTPALFPSAMLPAMSITGGTPQPAKPPQETRHEERDELVEVGAMLAILKLVFG